ncbi:MAG: flippase [Lachnospiraceae bacterium]|nr:flippase [Lachnospiraceae bacterium]
MSKSNKKFRSLGVNAALNAIKSGLSVIFPLITYPYAFRILHAEGMGKINYATSIVSYFSMIAALGITTYAVREGAKIRDDRENFTKFSNQIFTFNLITTIVAYVLLGLFLAVFDSFQSYSGLIWLLSLSIAFTTLGVEWINTIYEDYLFITIRSIFTHVISLVLLFVFVRDADDYYWYAGLTVLTNAIICITNWVYCRRYTRLKVVKQLEMGKHIRPIFTLFANSVATSIYVSADTTMLGWFAGDYYVGIYSIAVKIYNVAKQMLVALYSVTISRISFYIGQGDTESVRKTYTSMLSNITLLLLPASVGLISISREVILFMGGNEYMEAVPTLQILSISLVGAIFGGAVTYCLNIPLGRERVNVIATICSAVINIGLNLVLIPIFKQNGAAVTTAISEFFVFLFCVFSFKEFKNYVDLKLWARNGLQAIIGCGLILLISAGVRAVFSNTWIILILIICLSVLAYGVELLLFKNELVYSILRKMKIMKK